MYIDVLYLYYKNQNYAKSYNHWKSEVSWAYISRKNEWFFRWYFSLFFWFYNIFLKLIDQVIRKTKAPFLDFLRCLVAHLFSIFSGSLQSFCKFYFRRFSKNGIDHYRSNNDNPADYFGGLEHVTNSDNIQTKSNFPNESVLFLFQIYFIFLVDLINKKLDNLRNISFYMHYPLNELLNWYTYSWIRMLVLIKFICKLKSDKLKNNRKP
jgi:hypothetical protein